MIGERIEAAVAGLRAAVDVLLEADLTMLGSPELTGLLRHLEVQRRRLTAVDHRVVSEVDQRGAAGEHGRTGAADLLTTMLRVAPGEAKARVAQARATQPTRRPSGDLIAAQLPQCAAAAVAGEVSAAHVTVIARTLDRIPAHIADDAVAVAEAMLVEAARHQDPDALARTGALLLARLDPDGVEPGEEELQRRRAFTLSRRADGSVRVSGEWTPEVAGDVAGDIGFAVSAVAGRRRCGAGRPLPGATAPRRHGRGRVPAVAFGHTAVEQRRAGHRTAAYGSGRLARRPRRRRATAVACFRGAPGPPRGAKPTT